MKYRALFILPPDQTDFGIINRPHWNHCHVPSIGLVLLCSYLQAKGHDIKIIDCRELLAKYRTKEYIQFVLRLVEEFRPDVIGINMLSALFDEAKNISCALKHRFPDIQIITGGPHPSVEPVLTLQQIPYIDAICVGPGEEVCLELLEGNNPIRIKGLMRRGYTDVFEPRPVVRDIDKYPFPNYSLVHDNHYTDFTINTVIGWGFRSLSGLTSRSCPYSCKFCASDWSKPFRYHSPEYTIEMAKYLATHDIDAITFFDDTLASIEDRLYKICEGFIGERIFYPYSKLRWFAGIRANQVKPALLKMMKRAGCFSVNIGIESGTERMLQVINKKTTVEMNKQACACVKEAGLCLGNSFMVGIPGETEEEMEQTLEFMRNVDCNMKGVGAFRPLPGSPFYYEFIDKKILIKQEIDWSNLGNFSLVPKYIFCNATRERLEQIYNEALQLAYGQQWIMIHEDVLKKFPDTIREIARTKRVKICKSDNYESSHHIPFDPLMLGGKELNSVDKEMRIFSMSPRKEEGSRDSQFLADGKHRTIGHICKSPEKRMGFEVFDSQDEIRVNNRRKLHLALPGKTSFCTSVSEADIVSQMDRKNQAEKLDGSEPAVAKSANVHSAAGSTFGKKMAYTEVPGRAPIEMVAYYPDFLDYYPRCEMLTKRWFVENVQPDWVILDCGANIGYYSIMFAQLAPNGHVYAFEPTNTIEKLRQNIEHNGVRNVTCVEAALGNKIGQHVDKIYRIWGQEPDKQEYLFTTIDEFVRSNKLQRVDCIKIDVDSFDFEVLQGAAKTMASFNPFVMVELNHALNKRDQSNAEALEWLTRQGYEECVVFEYENYLFKKGYRYSGHEGRLAGLRLLFAADQSVLAEQLTNYLSGSQHQVLKDTGVGKYAEKSNRGFVKMAEANNQPIFGQSTTVGAVCAVEPEAPARPQQESSITIPSVLVQRLHEELGFARAIDYPQSSLNKPLEQWKMEVDDAPIFRYIYRNIRPRRHLEFGTWQGAGTLYCLEECDATVWSINLLAGEVSQDGSVAYGIDDHERASAQEWAKKMGLGVKDWPQTDSLGYTGRFYLEKGLGNRVCQIYSDSTKWDISNYPPGFFDTALIDGGHQKDIVINDTAKAFKLLRSGGLIIWHDFCPPIYDKFETTLGVMRAIHQQWEWINEQTLKLFWIYPSWILVGVKK
ncbi:MAG: FkbM family methyltransferase [Phycisphaerae bacterium]